jgi:glycosyltransferase involved in cell wall biosynthesis
VQPTNSKSTGADSRVLIVVPAWREEATIVSTIEAIRGVVPGAGLLVVDDGSKDRTAEFARAAGVAVASLPFNVGVGGAMRVGFLYAVREGYDAVVQVDADGQHDPAHVPDLLRALADADIAVGSRFAGTGGYQVHGPRRWAMVVLARILSGLTGTRLTDVTSGFRASGPRAIALFAQEYPMVVAHRAGLRFAEIPVEMRVRQGGSPSQGRLRSALYFFRAMLVLLLALVHTRQVNSDARSDAQ